MRTRALACILLCVMGPGAACARDYYVSLQGDDANPGMEARPWRTIEKANSTDFEPGDCLHFQGGERFGGTILLDDADDGLTITSYGNGIVVASTDDAIIEYCRAFRNGWDMPRQGNGPVGIWVWNVDRAIIQHCIAHDNKSPGDDGGGFDLDGGATNSILQYNLSYHNDGPGFFLCQFPGAADFRNNIIRYNISHNDGVRNNRRSGIDVYSAGTNASDCQVYNNTVYNDHGAAVGFGGLPMPNVVFRNNIFICTGEVVAGETGRGIFENNVFWPTDGHPLRWTEPGAGKYLDPKVSPAGKELPTDPTQLATMAAYKLQADSPCLKGGLLIEDNGGRDFWGNPIPQDGRPSIGACEKP